MEYHKLVRDKIPAIIESKGEKAVTHIADAEEYSLKLQEKLTEEVQEFVASGEIEELADILEVMMALAENHGSTWAEVERIRLEKFEQRGGFKDKIILDES